MNLRNLVRVLLLILFIQVISNSLPAQRHISAAQQTHVITQV